VLRALFVLKYALGSCISVTDFIKPLSPGSSRNSPQPNPVGFPVIAHPISPLQGPQHGDGVEIEEFPQREPPGPILDVGISPTRIQTPPPVHTQDGRE